jgi:ABC-type multidrug transport system fused ATPase/permease subunit
MIAEDRLTFGTLVSFFVALRLLLGPLTQGYGSVADIHMGTASLRSIFEALDQAVVPPYVDGTARPVLTGNIALQGVTFQYQEKTIVHDVTMTLVPGSTTALIGANGSGKTTLARLILGVYAPTKGQICADGIPYAQIDPAHLRSSFGFLPQDPDVFLGTITENIWYGSSPSLDDDARALLSITDGFISRLPDGYDTVVGYDGSNLSGGERQLICLVRVLMRKPAVLILDEPSVHLDRPTVRRLHDILQQLDWHPSILIITHEESLLDFCTDVQQVKDGALVRLARHAPRALESV